MRKPSAEPRKEFPLRALPSQRVTPSSRRRSAELHSVLQAALTAATSHAAARSEPSSRFCSRGTVPTSATKRSAKPSAAVGTPAFATSSSSSAVRGE